MTPWRHTKVYQPPEASFSFPVVWHLDDPVQTVSYNFKISFFLAAAVGTLENKYNSAQNFDNDNPV